MIDIILRALLYLSAGLDLGTTWKGMSMGQKEASPILGQSPYRQAAIVFGSVIGVDAVTRYALNHGALALSIVGLCAVAGAHLFASVLNLRRLR
jgi:hypothetical protein